MIEPLWLLAKLIVLFFSVTFFVQLVQRRLGPERLRSAMGGTPVASALKGIAIGFVTPFCTFTAIPMLTGLRQAGVPAAGYVAFISAAPVLDPVLFGALVLIAGPTAAALYAAIAFTGAMTLALIAQRAGIEKHLKPIEGFSASPATAAVAAVASSVPAGARTALATTTAGVSAGPGAIADDGSPCAAASACGDSYVEWAGLRAEIGVASRAAVALLRSVAWLLVIGVGVGVLIESTVSPADVARLTGGNAALAIPVAAFLGTPLYFDTSLFVPIADALSDAGLGIGAIVALTISGAGANIPEFVILSRLASRRLLVIFCGYVFAVALLGGSLAHVLLG